jgi:hypothetical protein
VLEGYLQRRPTNKTLVKRWQTRHVTLTRSSLTIRKKKDGTNPQSSPGHPTLPNTSSCEDGDLKRPKTKIIKRDRFHDCAKKEKEKDK